MFENFTRRGLIVFSYIFLILAALIFFGSIAMSIWGDFGQATDQFLIAARNLGRFMLIVTAFVYGALFVFLGLVSRALAILLKKSSINREHS